MSGSIFGHAGPVDRELIPCRDGPLDGETIFVKAPAPVLLRVTVGPDVQTDWVGPERVPVVRCQFSTGPEVRTVYVYGFCEHHHYHLEAVE